MKSRLLLALLACALLLCACGPLEAPSSLQEESASTQETVTSRVPASATATASKTPDAKPAPSSKTPVPPAADEPFPPPAYQGEPYATIGDNTPVFASLTTKAYETYPSLDALGRCGTAHACLGKELMPTEDRGSIGMVKPSGWQTAKYDFVDGKYLFNRCHLIGFQLSGENANECNLITGTRSMNVKGMLPFENMVADYIKETNHHVMYRVTPMFVGNELVARGVRMEAYSVEDQGEGICFDVYVFNVEPGVEIDYTNGSNRAVSSPSPAPSPVQSSSEQTGDYLLNTNTKKIHRSDCSAAKRMSEKNKKDFRGDPASLLSQGYDYCGLCF